MSKQVPTGEGVKDVPAVPGSLAKGGLKAPLGPVGSVPDNVGAKKGRTS
jgi:hypothetical protein